MAEALIVLGVLPADRVSARYWPGDFGAHAPPLDLARDGREGKGYGKGGGGRPPTGQVPPPPGAGKWRGGRGGGR